MDRLSNPWIWLKRFRHRCGYGVHSPFAFAFLTDVVYERNAYYAYHELDASLAWWQRLRIRRLLHLLIRIANHVQPRRIVTKGDAHLAVRYMQAGCRQAQATTTPDGDGPTLYFLTAPDDAILPHLREDSVVIVDDLRKHLTWFGQLPSIVTFDLYDLGIAFFDTKYNKQHYIVNF